MTVQRLPDQYRVTMNRDELRTRGPEHPPAIHSASGTSWIGPVDSDAGGTWIGTNEYGITACLLNAYFPIGLAPEAIQQGARSRGAIIPELLAQETLRACESWIWNDLDPALFAGFMLLLVNADSCAHYLWRGHGRLDRIEHEDEWTCLTSSFIDASDAEMWRYSMFRLWLERGARDEAGLPHFHLQQDKGKESMSPLMERDYSVTRSITQVVAAPHETCVRYYIDPRPHTNPDSPTVSLLLRRATTTSAGASRTG